MRVPGVPRWCGGHHPVGDATSGPIRLAFNPQLRVEFRGATVTSDAGLLLPRELDEQLFPRVGFIVTTLTGTNRAVVRFYNQRGTAEQWIKDAALLPPLPGQRGPPAARGHCLQRRQSGASAGPAGRHPELVADEPPATPVQDRRTPHSTCAVLRASTGRKSLDRESLSADPPAHRGAEVPPDLIERTAPIWEQADDAGGSLSEAGEAASGGPWNMRNPKRGCRENVRGTDQEWPGGFVRRHMVRSASREGSEHGPYRKLRLRTFQKFQTKENTKWRVRHVKTGYIMDT